MCPALKLFLLNIKVMTPDNQLYNFNYVIHTKNIGKNVHITFTINIKVQR
jgi:hypothetical protein